MQYGIKLSPYIAAGEGSVEKTAEIIRNTGAKNVLICSDKGIEGSGLLRILVDVVAGCQGTGWQVIDSLATEPAYTDVQAAQDSLGGMRPDLIIAIGGGSVMDAAKLFSVLLGAEYTVKDLLDDPGRAKKQVRTLMIPTTCGTGSEATCNAIVAVPERSVKQGIVNDEMIPDYVILDPQMLRRLPPAIVAATGVDALAHVVECYTSNKATPLSDLFALHGARLIFHNIVRAYEDPEDMTAKEAMLLGAFCGGVAITGSGTTAVHALSYPLGGKFHIAHGVSNAILFAPVMSLNRDACEGRLAALYDAVFPGGGAAGEREKSRFVIGRIEKIVRSVHIPTDLKVFGVSRGDLDFLVEAGSGQKRLLNNNCKQLTLEEIRGIYEEVLR